MPTVIKVTITERYRIVVLSNGRVIVTALRR